jgi:hypothetical protein
MYGITVLILLGIIAVAVVGLYTAIQNQKAILALKNCEGKDKVGYPVTRGGAQRQGAVALTNDSPQNGLTTAIITFPKPFKDAMYSAIIIGSADAVVLPTPGTMTSRGFQANLLLVITDDVWEPTILAGSERLRAPTGLHRLSDGTKVWTTVAISESTNLQTVEFWRLGNKNALPNQPVTSTSIISRDIIQGLLSSSVGTILNITDNGSAGIHYEGLVYFGITTKLAADDDDSEPWYYINSNSTTSPRPIPVNSLADADTRTIGPLYGPKASFLKLGDCILIATSINLPDGNVRPYLVSTQDTSDNFASISQSLDAVSSIEGDSLVCSLAPFPETETDTPTPASSHAMLALRKDNSVTFYKVTVTPNSMTYSQEDEFYIESGVSSRHPESSSPNVKSVVLGTVRDDGTIPLYVLWTPEETGVGLPVVLVRYGLVAGTTVFRREKTLFNEAWVGESTDAVAMFEVDDPWTVSRTKTAQIFFQYTARSVLCGSDGRMKFVSGGVNSRSNLGVEVTPLSSDSEGHLSYLSLHNSKVIMRTIQTPHYMCMGTSA